MPANLVFEPITINGCEVPNRIARSAHGTGLTERGPINQAFIDYHLARAKGGVGLTILEATTVHPSSVTALPSFDDGVIAGYRELMRQIRPHGMRVFQQLWHAGHIYPSSTGAPPWGVSSVPDPMTGLVPTPMGETEIEEVVASFVAAARRSREGGIDGIEIHAAHGYLIMQFLSPLTNTRTDRFGGSLQNRMRFLRMILTAVRKNIGEDYPLGIRVSASLEPGGLGEPELQEVVRSLRDERLIDFLDVSLGDYYIKQPIVGAMDRPAGYQLKSSAQITEAVPDIARMVIGRFRTLEEAEQVIRDGAADIVHMTRAHIADPDLVRKTRTGRPDSVRPCIGCNQGCWHNRNKGFPLGCTVNAAAGREGDLAEDLIRPADVARKVLIVGGGPAGMEAARVAALCGHRVTLVEAAADLGGQLVLARRAPRLHTIGDIAHWLEQEVFRLGVDVRLGSYFEAADVLAEAPDLVVVATGALPREDGVQPCHPARPVPGWQQPHVISGMDLLAPGRRPAAKNAVVVDGTGHYEAIAATEYLLQNGVPVTFVTHFDRVGTLLDPDTRVETAFVRFSEYGGFSLRTRSHLTRIDATECEVSTAYRNTPELVAADLVVLVNPKEGLRGLHDELRDAALPAGIGLLIVGDAQAPRDLQAAIGEGHRAIRSWHSGLER
jgi:2,4-dienoyl-CoA reductase-like NADH-dependent reductase (Old Yellow Enzyme family)